MKYYLCFIFFVILTFVFSCIDDAPSDFGNPESNWKPSFSFPIGYASLGMDEDSGFDTTLLALDTLSGFPYWFGEIDIPLNYSMPFNMQELNGSSEQIVSIMFRLNTKNGFPNTINLQFYFQDINSVNIDSMFTDGPLVLGAGIQTGNEGKVNKTANQNDVIIDQNKISDLELVQYIFVKGAINNVEIDTNLVEFYPNYNIDLQLGIKVELNLSLSGKLLKANN